MNIEELKNFDAIEWIDNYFAKQANINEEQLRPILHFSLIWNLFETLACHTRADVHSIRRSVDRADLSGKLEKAKYMPYVAYFQNRYKDNSIEQTFKNLLMTDPKSKIVVEKTLSNETQDINNIVYALLLIAHRIRNNLFHGNKGVEFLHKQTELFQIVNHLLSDYIDDIK